MRIIAMVMFRLTIFFRCFVFCFFVSTRGVIMQRASLVGCAGRGALRSSFDVYGAGNLVVGFRDPKDA
ncbi:hypothetical protein I7I53_11931 [Histoplasma capsulatum var. duboisii H88]|uniref:Uncharacterized protein n=1 Tax=Ajellomyces capsulatus (strain H88) TaxID=544711 RepID=A0A8A1LU90_AJEC8|nr:hypothetical protein I7I53_11931 [Histoplasma capsulatum var. duboisii H88]